MDSLPTLTSGNDCSFRNPARFLDTRVSDICIAAVFLFFLIEDPLESYFSELQLFDEILTIVLCVAAFIKGGKVETETKGEIIKIIVGFFVIAILGLLGNAFCGYQTVSIAIAKDCFAFLKFPLVVIASGALLCSCSSKNTIHLCSVISTIFVSICFVFGIINTASPIADFSHDYRGGIMSFKFIFSHPTFLVLSLVLCFAVLAAENKKLDKWKVMCLLAMLLTMRDKAFGFIALVVAGWLFRIYQKKRVVPYFIAAGVVVLCVAWPKISEYIAYSNSPRETLYRMAISIANSGFPFGSGFASIASPLSGEYYSSAYYAFGASAMEGMTPTGYFNLGDAGLAYYLGVFGWLGFLLFIFLVFCIYRLMSKRLVIGSSARYAVFCLFGYIVIALTVENVLTNASGVEIAFVLSIISMSQQDDSRQTLNSINSQLSEAMIEVTDR